MAKTLTTGNRAPDVALVDVSGQKRPLAGLVADWPVLLVFFKVSCPTCQLTLPYLDRLEGGALSVYGVSQDSPELTRQFCDTYGVEIEMLYDREEDNYPASNAFAITNVPTLFVVERDLRISFDLTGFHKGDLMALARRAARKLFRDGEQVPALKAG